MTRVPAAHRALAAKLQELHDHYSSWSKVQRHYPTIPRGTLCTIAKSKGARIPKKHWQALGLVVEQGRRRRAWLPGEARTARKIGEMAKETREQVLKVKR
jgi:hypothetical protein